MAAAAEEVFYKPSALAKALVRPCNDFQPHKPTVKQRVALYLARHRRELLFGGAAGGGKTDLLLHAALDQVHRSEYRALLIRRTFAQLDKADGLLERSQEWLAPTKAHWNGEKKQWIFPSGAKIEFGHCQYEKNKEDYQGSAYQFVGFDELTQFTDSIYRYIAFSRMRRLVGGVPLVALSTSNPGGVGHKWVAKRFGLAQKKGPGPNMTRGRAFIPSKVVDNPFLDLEEYIGSLSELDPLTRQRLLDGDWSASESGDMFDPAWLNVVPAPTCAPQVRFWDLAGTKPTAANEDPDWSRGCLAGAGPQMCIHGFASIREEPGPLWEFVARVAKADGPGVMQVFEQEPAAAGKAAAKALRDYLRGEGVANVFFEPATKAKSVRATPLANDMHLGQVDIVDECPGFDDFLEELVLFRQDGTGGGHDDTVDAAAGARNRVRGRWGWGNVLKGTKARREKRDAEG